MANSMEKHYTNKLASFSSAVWNNPQAVFKHDSVAGFDYLDLTEHAEACMFLLGRPDTKILIRQEYRDALEALEKNELYRAAAYVTGHPGIGKTHFLVYVLVEHLAQKRPIAWHHATWPTKRYVVFRETATIHPLTDYAPLMESGPLWGLSASNPAVFQPPEVFYCLGPVVRTIQVTTPDERRWKGWSEDAGAKCYIMDVWPPKEIAALAKLVGENAERMTYLAEIWGGVPRNLLQFLYNYEDDLKTEYEGQVNDVIMKGAELFAEEAYPGNTSFMDLYRPRVSLDGTIDREHARIVISSTAVRSALGM